MGARKMQDHTMLKMFASAPLLKCFPTEKSDFKVNDKPLKQMDMKIPEKKGT